MIHHHYKIKHIPLKWHSTSLLGIYPRNQKQKTLSFELRQKAIGVSEKPRVL